MERQRGDRAAHAGVGIGHRRRPVLVASGDEAGAPVDQGVRDVEVAGPDDAEHLADAELSQRPPDDGGRKRHRSTNASTRAGLPEPDTMGSGPAMRTAPVAGSSASRCSCVRPYLPLPSR